jgi:hypothetical protein
MTISVDNMILELRAHTGTDDQDLSDADVTLLLNRSYWDLIDQFKFREKEVICTIQTIIGENFYKVPQPFEAIQLLAIEDPVTFKHDPLSRMTEYDYEQIFVNDPSTNEFNKPTQYMRKEDGIILWRTPDQIYNVTIYYWTTLADLVSGSQSAIPQVWDEIIVWGGIARAYKRLGDFARGESAQTEQDRLIQKRVLVAAKEEVDTHKGGLDVIGYDDVYWDIVRARDVSRGLNWPWR